MTVAEIATLSAPAEKIRTRLAGTALGSRVEIRDLDLPTLEVSPADWPALARHLRDDPQCGFDLFLDLAGVGNPKGRGTTAPFAGGVPLPPPSARARRPADAVPAPRARPHAPSRAVN